MPMLLGYVDKARCYQLINRTFEEWFTVDRNQVRGMPLGEVHEPRLMQLITYYMDVALGGREVRFEASIPYAGVSTVPGYRGNRQIELIFTPDVIAGGRVDGFFVAASDVTQRMLDTAQLHQSQKMEAVGQLTGGVAHDFNNLLAVIVGSLALLEEKVGDGRERKLVDAALRSARRGADLTQRLLAFGRRQALMTEIVDANELVYGLTELLRRTLGVSIEIQTQLGGDLWQMNVDGGQL
ncbi:MAG: PAS domain-containing protein, partial [Rhodospirillaceae bacterium]|nr:PAS domain-containing protein [Rhodospirillaceae bacterium]